MVGNVSKQEIKQVCMTVSVPELFMIWKDVLVLKMKDEKLNHVKTDQNYSKTIRFVP